MPDICRPGFLGPPAAQPGGLVALAAHVRDDPDFLHHSLTERGVTLAQAAQALGLTLKGAAGLSLCRKVRTDPAGLAQDVARVAEVYQFDPGAFRTLLGLEAPGDE